MNTDRKAKGRRQAFGSVVPASATIRRAPYAVVVLLIQQVTCARRTHHVVDAVTNVTIARRGGVVMMTARFCVRKTVPALPCRSAVLGREDAGRRDSNPEFFRVGWITYDSVQHQPGSSRVPAAGRGVVRKSSYPFPIFSAVLTGQQACWFGASV